MKDFAGTWTIQPLTQQDLLHNASAADQMSQSKQQGTEAMEPTHLLLGFCFPPDFCSFHNGWSLLRSLEQHVLSLNLVMDS